MHQRSFNSLEDPLDGDSIGEAMKDEEQYTSDNSSGRHPAESLIIEKAKRRSAESTMENMAQGTSHAVRCLEQPVMKRPVIK